MTQPRGHGVDAQAALQPVAGATVAQAVAPWPLDSGSGGHGMQVRFCDALGNPAGRGPGREGEYA